MYRQRRGCRELMLLKRAMLLLAAFLLYVILYKMNAEVMPSSLSIVPVLIPNTLVLIPSSPLVPILSPADNDGVPEMCAHESNFREAYDACHLI